MQHVLRCWERQSDGTEYKKTLRRLGIRPGPRWRSLSALPQTPSWWGGAGCPSPRTPSRHPPVSALRASPLLPHSKISSDAVDSTLKTAILFYQFRPSVRPSVRLSVCPMPILCLNKWTYRHSFFRRADVGIVLVFLRAQSHPSLQNSNGNLHSRSC